MICINLLETVGVPGWLVPANHYWIINIQHIWRDSFQQSINHSRPHILGLIRSMQCGSEAAARQLTYKPITVIICRKIFTLLLSLNPSFLSSPLSYCCAMPPMFFDDPLPAHPWPAQPSVKLQNSEYPSNKFYTALPARQDGDLNL